MQYQVESTRSVKPSSGLHWGVLAQPINLAGIVLLVCFFLPWLSSGPFGLDQATSTATGSVAQQFSAAVGTEAPSMPVYVYALYLIPLGCVAGLVLAVLGKTYNICHLVAAVVFLLVLLYGLIDGGTSLLSRMGFGEWLSLLASVAISLAFFGIIKRDS